MARPPSKPFEAKFPECHDCIFFRKRNTQPVCLECDNGEFFERKTRRLDVNLHDDIDFNRNFKDFDRYD